MVEPEPIPKTLAVKQEYNLDETPVPSKASSPHIYTLIHTYGHTDVVNPGMFVREPGGNFT